MRYAILTAVTACAIGGFSAATPSSAAPLVNGVPALQNDLLTDVQFRVYGGRRYCFYPVGWHGPGWYRCGFASRRGLGWGGIVGWQGWDRGSRSGGREERRDVRGRDRDRDRGTVRRNRDDDRGSRGGDTDRGAREGRGTRGDSGGGRGQSGAAGGGGADTGAARGGRSGAGAGPGAGGSTNNPGGAAPNERSRGGADRGM